MAKRIITALDIGSSKVCAVIASVETDMPQVIGVASYPSEGIKKGVIVNIDQAINSIATVLEAAERMAGITVSSVFVSISGKHIMSTNNKGVVAISSPEIVTDDVFRSIESAKTVSIPQSREILHVIPREFIVDSQGGVKDPVGMTGTRLEVDAHIVSATTTSLHNLVKCVEQLGLKIDDVVFSGWSSSISVLTDTERELGVMLLDIGGGVTSIATFIEDAITYSGCIPFGGTNVTSDIAIGLRASLDDAEKIKTNIGELIKRSKQEEEKGKSRRPSLVDKDKDKESSKKKKNMVDISSLGVEGLNEVSIDLFNEIVEARLSEIFDLVTTQVEQAGFDVKMPAGIVLAGGSAMLPNITKIAKDVFKVPARVGYPKGLEGLVEEITDPAFATSQGLILYGMMENQNMSGGSGISSLGDKGGGVFGKLTGWFKNLLP